MKVSKAQEGRGEGSSGEHAPHETPRRGGTSSKWPRSPTPQPAAGARECKGCSRLSDDFKAAGSHAGGSGGQRQSTRAEVAAWQRARADVVKDACSHVSTMREAAKQCAHPRYCAKSIRVVLSDDARGDREGRAAGEKRTAGETVAADDDATLEGLSRLRRDGRCTATGEG